MLLEKHVVKHKGCYNCPVSCSSYCSVKEGPWKGTRGEGPEYETISSLGSKCGNDDLEAVLHANMLCNQLGLDTISTGNTIAWAMECFKKKLLTPGQLDGQQLKWGDADAMTELIYKIALREGAGDLLADGPLAASKKIGGSGLVVQSKGMYYPAVDVRGTKCMPFPLRYPPGAATI